MTAWRVHPRSFLLVVVLLAWGGNTVAQVGESRSPLPATMREPSNLAEAAGIYIGAVEQLHVLKASRCGYALKRQISNFEKVVVDEILPAFPSEKRNEVASALRSLKPDMTRQGQAVFDNFYTYYTQTEKLDNNTACGFIAGAFISLRKLTAEAFERAKSKRL